MLLIRRSETTATMWSFRAPHLGVQKREDIRIYAGIVSLMSDWVSESQSKFRDALLEVGPHVCMQHLHAASIAPVRIGSYNTRSEKTLNGIERLISALSGM